MCTAEDSKTKAMIEIWDKLYRSSVKWQLLPTDEEAALSGTAQKAENELLYDIISRVCRANDLIKGVT